jgi:hypothetical protein
MYWLYGSGSGYDANIAATISSFMTSMEVVNIMTFLKYWSEATRNTLVKSNKDELLPRILVSLELLKYLLEFSNLENRNNIYELVFASKPNADVLEYAVSTISDESIVAVTLGIKRKVQSDLSMTDYEEKIIIERLAKNTYREAKMNALASMTTLMSTTSESNIRTLERIVNLAKFQTADDKKDIARNLVSMFTTASVVVNEDVAKLVAYAVSILAKSTADRKAVLSVIMKVIPLSVDEQTSSLLLNSLSTMSINKKTYKSEIEDLNSRVDLIADESLKSSIQKRLKKI